MAGEIALSNLAERNPRFLKLGAEWVDENKARPRHLSELASAIGTVHLKEGNRKARKLFKTSLVDPTGNSLAQAEWATPRLGSLVHPRALEALLIHSRREYSPHTGRITLQKLLGCAPIGLARSRTPLAR
jgi:hypothetical protein